MFELKAKDLVNKYGFDDGLLFSDLLDDAGLDSSSMRPIDHEDWDNQAFDHAVLVEVVQTYLCPKLLGYEFDTCYSQSHNPIRIVAPEGCDSSLIFQSLEGISVHVSEAQVLDLARRMAPSFVPYDVAVTPSAG